ncbi:MAG: hypothetical protein ACU0HS_01605 [Paracoccus sp. (in: a-proteobacteria)]|uniref:hypothetical protein n=1 Tax=Paracoccus sp. TaxID=267 RepID=UPI004058B60F
MNRILLGLKIAALRVHQRDAFTFEQKACLQMFAGQLVVQRRELADMGKGRHADRGIPLLVLRCHCGLVSYWAHVRSTNA